MKDGFFTSSGQCPDDPWKEKSSSQEGSTTYKLKVCGTVEGPNRIQRPAMKFVKLLQAVLLPLRPALATRSKRNQTIPCLPSILPRKMMMFLFDAICHRHGFW
jgi:hypothetical protein